MSDREPRPAEFVPDGKFIMYRAVNSTWLVGGVYAPGIRTIHFQDAGLFGRYCILIDGAPLFDSDCFTGEDVREFMDVYKHIMETEK